MMSLGGPDKGVKSCGTSLSFPFFVSFVIILSLMIMNLFIAVVIEGFALSSTENSGVVTSDHYK